MNETYTPCLTAPFRETDPEFVQLFDRFALDDVLQDGPLDGQTRHLALLAALMGCQGLDAFRALIPAALSAGVTPAQLKETVYQAVPYLGLGRVLPFLSAANIALESLGVPLPLEDRATVTAETRLEAGSQAQVDIFGPQMRDFWQSGPRETRHINRWLAANCFGDYYTRRGLDLREREMITFCLLAAQGGCEPQLTSHAAANLRLGNSRTFLIAVISQCLPYIGYPRSLNALACVDRAEK